MKISKIDSFIHSFPRGCSGVNSDGSVEFACEALRLFLMYGPLLVPEVVSVPQLSGGTLTQPGFHILQSRFCMTVFEEEHLHEHMQVFGPISIVFSSSAILKAGAVPVFYFPDFEMGQDENALGLSLVHNLRSTIGLVQDLMYLKQMKRNDYQDLLGIELSQHEYELLNKVDNAFLKSTNRTPSSLNSIVGALQSISELLYPANRFRGIDSASLQYFSQREWRILSNMRLNGVETSAPLGSNVKKYLIELNRAFFTYELEFNGLLFKRIDKVEILEESIKGNILESIVGVYCSPYLKDHVSKLLSQFSINVDPITV